MKNYKLKAPNVHELLSVTSQINYIHNYILSSLT